MWDISPTDSGCRLQARRLAEQALAARHSGDQDEADRLFAEADRIDPAGADALEEAHLEPPRRRGGSQMTRQTAGFPQTALRSRRDRHAKPADWMRGPRRSADRVWFGPDWA